MRGCGVGGCRFRRRGERGVAWRSGRKSGGEFGGEMLVVLPLYVCAKVNWWL